MCEYYQRCEKHWGRSRLTPFVHIIHLIYLLIKILLISISFGLCFKIRNGELIRKFSFSNKNMSSPVTKKGVSCNKRVHFCGNAAGAHRKRHNNAAAARFSEAKPRLDITCILTLPLYADLHYPLTFLYIPRFNKHRDSLGGFFRPADKN